MKKLSAILVALMLAAVATVSVFAAGITSAEQGIIDASKTGVTTSEGTKYLPDAVVNQLENYLNTVDVDDETANAFKDAIAEGKDIIANGNVPNILDLSTDAKKELLAVLENAAAKVGGSVSYDYAEKVVTVKDADENVILTFKPVLVAKGADASTADQAKANAGVVKTTGADFSTVSFAIAGAAIALIVAGGVLYIVKSKKA